MINLPATATAAAGHIPVVIWWIIAFGGALTTAFTYMFGFETVRLHLTMTGAVAASLSLVRDPKRNGQTRLRGGTRRHGF